MIGAVFAALQDHSVADGVDSLLKCCNTILVDVFPRDTPESAGTANSSDAYHQPLIASANRAQLAILGDDSMYSAERWQAEMFRVPGARALCDSVLKVGGGLLVISSIAIMYPILRIVVRVV
jgi:hypothetical protein